MIELTDWFQLNSPGVVCDIVDDEVVIVHLESGAYYSTEKLGATIWQHLDNGQNVGGIIEAVSRQYAGHTNEIEKNVHALIEQLLAEDLIVAGNGTAPVAQSVSNIVGEQDEKEPFEGVILHKYLDMEDLLLLDPIHEVDEIGWPHAKDK